MAEIKHRSFYCVLFFFALQLSVLAAPPKNQGSRIRIDLAPAFGFYSINSNHAIDPRSKVGLALGFKKEYRAGDSYNAYFLAGVDYFFHGLNFRSYYFNPDSVKIYDKSFGYTYSLFIQEINVPLQFKYLLKREDNSLFSPYLAVGYHLRCLLPANLRVKQNETLVKSDAVDLRFKNSLFWDKLNAFVSLSLGWQKNHLTPSAKGNLFVELNFKYGFSAYSFQTPYSASSLYINATHLSLMLGLKF